ncbi:trypsin-like peptidase domain-containing protein [Streptomyces lunaelactis]|uniref:AAA family ATPase n=1 Tax=Streptomyces lunaelactis TaxID=1535768 RepID=UPI001584B127|nr:trypsin-like peptidase domain-containing protein [Streptomyces lunaelactis]NUL02181.1 trypsin-like peptidase domain-containing protein [Streptomyces lunaelactis]
MNASLGSGPRPGNDPWVAAVHADQYDDHPLGSGFLIDGRRVMTCAHVACPAWDKGAGLWVAFPKSDQLMDRRLSVSEVIAPSPEGRRRKQDVAILVLADSIPGESAAPLRRPTARDLVGKPWWCFGFPDGDVFGNSSDGTVGADLAYGWIRLDTDSRYSVRPGYSGAALWSPTYQAVVGVVGQANGSGDAHALTFFQADKCLPDQKLSALTEWSAQDAGESALAAWGWTLESDPEAGRHWKPRARGVSTDAERGFRFRGRTAALTEIVDWMTADETPRHVLVVTGSPGVGKSAVLGRVVTSADTAIAATLPKADDAVRAPLGSVSCAVHAKGKTALEVAREIARAASAAIPQAVGDLAPGLRAALTGTSRSPFTVVIDALDEATSAKQARLIACQIAVPLAETCADLRVRVLVGSRRRDDEGDLLAAFGDAAHLIDLDLPAYFEEADLAAYAQATLQLLGDERPGNPYADDRVARPVATRIARLADGNFLVAGLTSRTRGLHDTVAMVPADISFNPTVAAALHEYLARLPSVDGISAATVLTALAYAEAPGLPLSLWTVAITALHGSCPTQDRLRAFARSAAANFLIETGVNDQNAGVFRLFHQALDDALRQSRVEIEATEDDERALTRAFIAHGQACGWDNAPAYLLRSLPRHALRGRAVDDLLADMTYPLHADLRRLLPVVGPARTSEARGHALILRQTPLAIDAGHAERAALFSVTEAQEGLGGSYRGHAADSHYRAAWAQVTPQAEEAVLEGHTEEVRAVCGLIVRGRSMLASAADDDTLCLWDPVLARLTRVLRPRFGEIRALWGCAIDDHAYLAIGSGDAVYLWDPATEAGAKRLITLKGHDSTVYDLCQLQAADRTYFATASADKTVRLWDPATGECVQVITGHTDWVNTVCRVPSPRGDLLASAGVDATVRLWDPLSNETPLRMLTGHKDAINAMCAIEVGNRVLLATGGADATIRLWDPVTGEAVRTIRGRAEPVLKLCPLEVEGQSLLACTTGDAIQLWDPASDDAALTLRGHSDDIGALCTLPVHGRTFLASGGLDHTVRLWDPARVQSNEAHAVHAVSVVSVDGHTVLVTGGDDGVQVRDFDTGLVERVLDGPTDCVRALCPLIVDGRTLVASADDDHFVILWDLRSAGVFGEYRGHTGAVHAICSLTVNGRALLASASADCTVRVWDPETGETIHTLSHPYGVYAVCAVDVDGVQLLASASGGPDGRVSLWDPETGEGTGHQWRASTAVLAMCSLYIGEQSVIAAATVDGETCLWDAATGQSVHSPWEPGLRHASAINALCVIEHTGRTLLVTASSDRTVCLWDPATATLVMEVPVRHASLGVAWFEGLLVVGLDRGLQALSLSLPS